ncbi:hypothetical protein PGTUg99_021229 [Puccinia graminis f. sp. tritici]|uniref:Uncharacterized protein n=1 Tax=Puccinia graminis f. sp. tritici TaxID=56615 RepID=A0A5B0RDZ4_PUCGR|nr:hypothetical protein PGTUg99_021229 [Puccinia graminis f. sp. tritici]
MMKKRMELGTLAKGAAEISQPALRQPGASVEKVNNMRVTFDPNIRELTVNPPAPHAEIEPGRLPHPEPDGEKVNGVKFNPDVRLHEYSLHPDAPPAPNFKKALADLPRLDPWMVRAWKTLKVKLSSIKQRIITFFRPPAPPGPFDLRFDRQRELSQLLLAKKGVDLGPDIERFLQKSLKDYSKPEPYLQEKYNPRLDKYWKPRLKKSVRGLQDILIEDDAAKQSITVRGKEISHNIQPIMQKGKMGSDPVVALGKKLATENSKILAKDQKIIKSYLPEDQKYLSGLLGFFGPKNVLSPHIQALFQERVQFRDWNFGEFVDAGPFVQKVEQVQEKLAEMARFRRVAYLAKTEGHPFDKQPPPELMVQITEIESQLVTTFGGRDKFVNALNMIKESDIHKGFMHELNNPRSLTGHHLQFLEPWGYYHKSSEIPVGELNLKRLGVTEDMDSIKTIDGQSAIALGIIQNRLEFTAKAQKGVEKIEEFLTPEGLQSFLEYMKQNPRKSNFKFKPLEEIYM